MADEALYVRRPVSEELARVEFLGLVNAMVPHVSAYLQRRTSAGATAPGEAPTGRAAPLAAGR